MVLPLPPSGGSVVCGDTNNGVFIYFGVGKNNGRAQAAGVWFGCIAEGWLVVG